MRLGPEETGYWYLRLNGFLTIPNFIVHPDEAANQVTDVDVMGVRFPYRAELLHNPMPDEPFFVTEDGKPLFVLAEIKKGRCQINPPILNPKGDALRRILRALGAVPPETLNEAVHNLHHEGSYSSDTYRIRFLCLGEERSEALEVSHPDALQVTWDELLDFIFSRFEDYRGRKHDHDQWDAVGHFLWNAAAQIRGRQEFSEFIRNVWVASSSS